jgi:hypothetical protein
MVETPIICTLKFRKEGIMTEVWGKIATFFYFLLAVVGGIVFLSTDFWEMLPIDLGINWWSFEFNVLFFLVIIFVFFSAAVFFWKKRKNKIIAEFSLEIGVILLIICVFCSLCLVKSSNFTSFNNWPAGFKFLVFFSLLISSVITFFLYVDFNADNPKFSDVLKGICLGLISIIVLCWTVGSGVETFSVYFEKSNKSSRQESSHYYQDNDNDPATSWRNRVNEPWNQPPPPGTGKE